MVVATIGWLENYPVPHATTWNTRLGLEKQLMLLALWHPRKTTGLICVTIS